MARRLTRQQIAAHGEAAARSLCDELCDDLAWKHSGCVADWNQCEECRSLTNDLRAASADDSALGSVVRRCRACEARQSTLHRYKQIALLLAGSRRRDRHRLAMGEKRFLADLDRLSGRYTRARLRDSPRAVRLHTLADLAYESSDSPSRKRLRAFLGAVFARWREYRDPNSRRYQTAMMHQVLGSKAFEAECAKRRTTPLGELMEALPEKHGQDVEQKNAALRSKKKRDFGKVAPVRPPIRVTIR